MIFEPTWAGIIEGWAVGYVSKNVWRTEPEYDFDDLMQECYLVFMLVDDHYPLVVEAPHFMALFKKCVFNRIHDLANRRTLRGEIPGRFHYGDARDIDDELEITTDSTPSLDDHARLVEWKIFLTELPESVRRVVVALVDDRPPVYMRDMEGIRETRSQYLCRLSGLDPQFDLSGIIVDALEGIPL